MNKSFQNSTSGKLNLKKGFVFLLLIKYLFFSLLQQINGLIFNLKKNKFYLHQQC